MNDKERQLRHLERLQWSLWEAQTHLSQLESAIISSDTAAVNEEGLRDMHDELGDMIIGLRRAQENINND